MMAFSCRISRSVLLVIVHLCYIWVDHAVLAPDPLATTEPTTEKPTETPILPDNSPPPIISNVKDTDFIEPENLNDNIDVFAFKSKEYLFVDIKLMHEFAELMCSRNYEAQLASIPNVALAEFLAEALSETNLEFESLWVGGKSRTDENGMKWNWIKNNYSDPISDDILTLIDNKDTEVNFTRNCLAFARKHHEHPQFKNLNCQVQRAFMCERTRNMAQENNSTHPGWITIGDTAYKIFREKVPHEIAASNCVLIPNSTLAIVDTIEKVTELGRHLLIGRPSLENAWIGAKWNKDKYEFEDDVSILVENNTNPDTNFPPWRNNTIRKTDGCILLDRHLSNTTLFIEARCLRLRSYICSRRSYNDSSPDSNYTVTVFPDREYHLYHNMQPWDIARKTCESRETMLAEPRNDERMQEVLFVMGQNVSTLSHIWIGGRLLNDTWSWISNQDSIAEDLPFIKNTTYIQEIEYVNTCLNLDREDHIKGLFYGTVCSFPQRFLCEKEIKV